MTPTTVLRGGVRVAMPRTRLGGDNQEQATPSAHGSYAAVERALTCAAVQRVLGAVPLSGGAYPYPVVDLGVGG